ncbi:MAG: hypothetical protein HC908_13090 [Calothrix sp. SM1_7_51]|nr:hypothetical protein [Calothrix sp. SM1_7_51]
MGKLYFSCGQWQFSAPMFAELHSQKEQIALQKLVSTSAKWMFFRNRSGGVRRRRTTR